MAVRRLPTGVPGLDQVLGGGLAAGSTTALAGSSGTGKTTMAQQICFANATTEHPAVYYTALSESHTKLITHLEQFDFYVPRMLGSQVRFVHLGDLITRGDGGLEPMISEVLRDALETQPSIVAIDNTSVLRDYADERQMRRAFYDLDNRLAHTGATLLLIGDDPQREPWGGAEFALADNIIHLAYESREPIDRRWLRAVKVRYAKHLTGKHALRIDSTGCNVFPRIETFDFSEPASVNQRIASGTPGLDELMGGGIGVHEASMVLGPSGVGKTILGLQFINQALAQQEHCLYVTFQDTPRQLTKMASGFGWDLAAACARGHLTIHHVLSDHLDLDVLAHRVRERLAQNQITRVVIDSLTEMVMAARETERFAAFARSLIGMIRSAGATVLITTEIKILGLSDEPGEKIMYIFDNAILLRYVELPSQTGRVVSILKMRNSAHSQRLHFYDIDERGLVVGEPVENVTGVLGGRVLRIQPEST